MRNSQRRARGGWPIGLVALLATLTSPAGARAEDEPPEGSLVVRAVTAEDRRPIPGASVRLHDASHRPIREGTTDEAGVVRWSLPAARYGAVHVRAPGRSLARAFVGTLRARQEVERTAWLSAPVPLRGHVLEAGEDRPLGGARVRLRLVALLGMNRETWWDFEEHLEETATDAEGRFVFPEAPPAWAPGSWQPHLVLESSAPGHATASWVLWDPGRVPQDLVVRLPKDARVEGSVLERDGSPSVGAKVEVALSHHPWMLGSPGDAWVDVGIFAASGSYHGFHPESALPATPPLLPLHPTWRTWADAAGRFELPALVAGVRYVLRAERDLGGASRPATVTLPAGGGSVTQDLRLRFDASVTVTVRDAPWEIRDGLLLAGRSSQPVAGVPVVLRGWSAPDAPRIAEGTTDALGRLTLDGLPCRSVEVSVDGYVPRSARLDLRPGDDLRVEFVRWPAGALRMLRGRVVDDLGRPIPGAQVHASPGGYHAISDAEGRFAFDAPDLAGMRLRVEVSGRGGAARSRRMPIPAGPIDGLDVAVPRLARVTLVVQRPEGAPEPGPYLDVASDGEASPIPTHIPWPDGARRTEATISCDPATRRITVRGEAYVPLVFDVDLEPGGEVTLPARTLDPGRVLTGRLLDPGGAPLGPGTAEPGASAWEAPRRVLHVSRPRPGPDGEARLGDHRAVPGEDGTFRFSGLQPGPVTLDVEVDGDLALRQEIVVPADGDRAPLEVRLPPPATLALRIRDRSGRPVPLAVVRLVTRRASRAWFEPQDGVVRAVPSDLAGRIDLDVFPGPYRLEVLRQDAPEGEPPALGRDLDLAAGEAATLDLRMD